MERFFEDEWFPRAFSVPAAFVPPMDVYEKGDAIIVETPLAGLDPSQVHITVEDDVLTIRGSVAETKEVKDRNYYRREIRSGEFVRSVALPVAVKSGDAQAAFKDGLLTITLPKETPAKPKAVKVEVKKA